MKFPVEDLSKIKLTCICKDTKENELFMDETETAICENGHVFYRENLESAYAYALEMETSELVYSLPAEHCPFCRFEDFSRDDLKRYLQKKYDTKTECIVCICKNFNLSVDEVTASWKNEFVTYENFKNFVTSG
jgi:hypothetical protein